MPSSLFQNGPSNSLLSAVQAIKGLGGNPQAAYERLYSTDPQFRQFADSMRGKTPEQAFRDYGLDYAQLQGLFR